MRARAATLVLAGACFPVLGGCGLLGKPIPIEHEELVREDGLQIQDLVVPKGRVAVTGDKVTIHYVGMLPDGTVFDSSVERGVPVEIELGKGLAMRGIEEGVVGMHLRGKRRLLIPPELAFGPGGNPPAIPAGVDLTVEVELLAIE